MRRRVLLAATVVAVVSSVLPAAPSQADPGYNPFGWPVVSVGPGSHYVRKSGYLPVNPTNQVGALCLIDDPRCDHWLLEVRDFQGAVPCVGIAAERTRASAYRPQDQKLQISVYRLTPGALATSELVAVSYDGTLLFWGDREMGLMAGTYAVAIGRGRTYDNPVEGPVGYRIDFASVLVGTMGLGYPFAAPDDLLLCVPGTWAADTGVAVARRTMEPFVTTSTLPTVPSVPLPPSTVPTVTVPPITVPPVTVPPTTVPEPPSGTPGISPEITVRVPFVGNLVIRLNVPPQGLPPDPSGPPPTVEIDLPPPPTVPPTTVPTPPTVPSPPTVPPVTAPPVSVPPTTLPPTTVPPTTVPPVSVPPTTVPPITVPPPPTVPEPPLLNPGRWPVVSLDADEPVQIRSSTTASIGLPCTPIWGDCDHTLLHVRGFDGPRACVGLSTRKDGLVRRPYELQVAVHRIQPGVGVGEVVARSHDGTVLFAAEPGATYGVAVGRAEPDYDGAPFDYDLVLAAGDPALELVERHPDASSCSPASWVRDWFTAIGRALQAFLP